MADLNRKPRIAVVSHSFPTPEHPHRGHALYLHMQALRRYADVEIYCVDPGYPSMRLLQPRTFPYASPKGTGSADQGHTRYVRYPALPLLSRPWNGASCARQLLPLLAPEPPDLILGYFAYPAGEAAIRLGRRLGIPVIIGVLGSDVRIARGWTKRAVRRVLQSATFVTGVSEELCQQAVSLGAHPDRIRAIHNGCDPTVFRPADRAEARVELGIGPETALVLFVGNLVPLKGLRELFEAMALLVRRRPTIELACIGEGPLDNELRSLAERDFPGSIRMLGVHPPHKVARWLAASNLLCLPSHSEGCPNVVIEALSAGRPVVASDVGGIPELLDPASGVMITPRDPVSLIRGIEIALDRNWDERVIAAKSNRSWQDVGRDTFAVCELVLSAARQVGVAAVRKEFRIAM